MHPTSPKGLALAQGKGKTAFVVSGSGNLGAIEVGMLRVLLASGVCPDVVVGAAIGAINAALFRVHP